MNKQTSSYIETFLNYLSEVDRSYPLTKAELKKKDDETQDILHELELGEEVTTIKKEQKLQPSWEMYEKKEDR